MASVTVEIHAKRLIVRLHALTARRHRAACASLAAEFPMARWDDEHAAYSIPLAYRPRLESWLASHVDPAAIRWVRALEEVRSA